MGRYPEALAAYRRADGLEGAGSFDVGIAGRAYDERQVFLVRAKVSPWLDPLRADPRFQDLVRRMHFP